jgi:hypothetical protein
MFIRPYTYDVFTYLATAKPPASTTSHAPATTSITNTNNGQRFASSLALILGTAAALFFFN